VRAWACFKCEHESVRENTCVVGRWGGETDLRHKHGVDHHVTRTHAHGIQRTHEVGVALSMSATLETLFILGLVDRSRWCAPARLALESSECPRPEGLKQPEFGLGEDVES